MAYIIEAACGCNIGRRRTNNEDNFWFVDKQLPKENEGTQEVFIIEQPLQEEQYYGVFDGMGGECYGEEASFVAASVLGENEKKKTDFFISKHRYLIRLVQKMNSRVCERAEELKAGRMGSTAVMFYLNKKYIYVCNVGDSRAFRLKDNELLQISKDHTDAKFLAEQGIKNRKPGLTQHLGIWPEEMILEPYVAKGRMKDGDQYLLCSDGLTDMVPNVEICSIMKASESAQECVEKLIDKALENGGKDNITVIVIRVRKEQEKHDEGEEL